MPRPRRHGARKRDQKDERIPPELMEELVEEILLRFPPDDPASLIRAATVCKLWCRLVSGTSFRRRFRVFHRRAAPLLGVIRTGNCKIGQDDGAPRDTNPSSLKPVRVTPWPTAYFVRMNSAGVVHAPDGTNWVTIGVPRHGRVLLYRGNPWHHTVRFSVWDPFLDKQQDLPEKMPFLTLYDYYTAVVCAATAGGDCDHLDCHQGPFLVVFMEIRPLVLHLSVYSSEAGAWSHLPGFELPLPRMLGWFRRPPSVLMGSALYLLIPLYDEIVKYDFATREVSAIPLPSKLRPLKLSILPTDDDGEIGFVMEKEFRRLLLPTASRRNTPGNKAAAGDDAAPPSLGPKGSADPVVEFLAQCGKSESIV